MEPQTLSEFLDWEPEYEEAILGKGILYAGTKAIVYGRYKSMKSMLVQRLGLDVANGTPWLGIETPPKGLPVLYLQLELPHARLQKRVIAMSNGQRWTKEPIVFWTEHFLKLDTPLGMAKLDSHLNRWRPRLLIIDPVYKVLSGDILDAHSIQVLLDNMDKVIEKYMCSIILVSHTRKPIKDMDNGGGRSSDDLLGSVFFSAWADSVIKVEKGDGKLRVNFDVIRHAEEDIEPIIARIDTQLTFPVDNQVII